jgi:hypothetical protein
VKPTPAPVVAKPPVAVVPDAKAIADENKSDAAAKAKLAAAAKLRQMLMQKREAASIKLKPMLTRNWQQLQSQKQILMPAKIEADASETC